MSIEAPKSCSVCMKPNEVMFCQVKDKHEVIELCSKYCFQWYKLNHERIEKFNQSILQNPTGKRLTIGEIKKIKALEKLKFTDQKCDQIGKNKL